MKKLTRERWNQIQSLWIEHLEDLKMFSIGKSLFKEEDE